MRKKYFNMKNIPLPSFFNIRLITNHTLDILSAHTENYAVTQLATSTLRMVQKLSVSTAAS